MVKFTLDSRPVEVPEGTTILQAADRIGVRIPRFCYHPAFAAVGSCRLCLVEIEGSSKLELSCSTPVRDGMAVRTGSDKVVEARRDILEFFLADHPIDCPICDKAGECDLQDYFQEFGLLRGAFAESKERRDKKEAIGKNLLLDRERCVLCTRCVRFGQLVTRTGELGVFQRGLKTEIGFFEGRPVNHGYSGCLSEICPVGAITDADFRFKTRAWFLERADSICPRCGRGCNIIIEHTLGFPRVPGSRRIRRIKARPNPEVNGFWICDLGRYGYSSDDVDRQECLKVREGLLPGPAAWEDVTTFLGGRLTQAASGRVGVIVSSLLSNEELFLVRRLFLQGLNCRKIFIIDPKDGGADGFLLTAERTPNRRGAAEIGFKFGLPDLRSLSGELDLAFLFGLHLFDHFRPEDIRTFLGSIPVKVLLTSRAQPEAAAFDLILPTPPPAEKSGSFVNVDGRVQGFAPVRPSRGQAMAEWDFLLRLARASGIELGAYSRMNRLEDVRDIMGLEFPAVRPNP